MDIVYSTKVRVRKYERASRNRIDGQRITAIQIVAFAGRVALGGVGSAIDCVPGRTAMASTRFRGCHVAACSLLLVGFFSASLALAAEASTDTVRITVLYDAFGKRSAMEKDWGYSAFVEYGGKRILFDTGDNPQILAHNAKVKGVDLARLDFVVLSHRHGDHMGGMDYLLRVNPNVKIYAPKENFGVYGSSLPGTFYRRDAGLPSDQKYFDGSPPEVMHFGSAWPHAHFELVDNARDIAPGIHLISLVSD